MLKKKPAVTQSHFRQVRCPNTYWKYKLSKYLDELWSVKDECNGRGVRNDVYQETHVILVSAVTTTCLKSLASSISCCQGLWIVNQGGKILRFNNQKYLKFFMCITNQCKIHLQQERGIGQKFLVTRDRE